MSKHDIDSINAAIALGDPVVPPFRVIIQFNQHFMAKFMIHDWSSQIRLGRVHIVSVNNRNEFSSNPVLINLYKNRVAKFHVKRVPEDVIPFAEWYRIPEVDR
jgi:hypothetical protein